MSHAKFSVVPAESPLERRIAQLERQQADRIIEVAGQKAALDTLVETKQRQIDNLRSLLPVINGDQEIRPVRLAAVGA